MRKIIDKLIRKDWSSQEIDKYLGEVDSAWMSYAQDSTVRQAAASGGTTTAILSYLLKNGDVDGALVCRSNVSGGRVRTQYYIATTQEELLESRGSKYVTGFFLQDALPLMREFRGKLAVVGLPCNLKNLGKILKKDKHLQDQIVLKIALFCGHSSSSELIDNIVSRMEKSQGSSLIKYKFRVGHWRGNLEAVFSNGRTLQKPFSKYFGLYQNLYFFCEHKCLSCYDHFGYFSDISVGDIWVLKMKEEPIKSNSVILRTKRATQIFSSACQESFLSAKRVDKRMILDGQSRTAPYHYNVSARSRAGKLLKINIPDTLEERVKWHQFISAFIALLNMKISENEKMVNLIFLTPKILLKFYLYIKKGLETLK